MESLELSEVHAHAGRPTPLIGSTADWARLIGSTADWARQHGRHECRVSQRCVCAALSQQLPRSDAAGMPSVSAPPVGPLQHEPSLHALLLRRHDRGRDGSAAAAAGAAVGDRRGAGGGGGTAPARPAVRPAGPCAAQPAAPRARPLARLPRSPCSEPQLAVSALPA